MSRKIDLNVDIGEGFPFDVALLQFATSANVAAGEHAGSRELTRETVALCCELGIRVGAHPGYPDRASMGRAETFLDAYEASLREQLDWFWQFEPAYIKPHGAWYHRVAAGGDRWLSDWCAQRGIPLMMLPHANLSEVALIREGFADRATLPNGNLVPRSQPGAVLTDPAEVQAQVLRVAPDVDSICLHGDGNHCVAFAQRVRTTLEEAGYEVSAW